MTRIWVLSDLHIDRNPGLSLGAHPDVDVIVIAGDLADGDFDPATWLMAEFTMEERCKTVMVLGNHEAYSIGTLEADREAERLADRTGLIALQRQGIEIAGHRVLGCTMWSPLEPVLDELGGDLHSIPSFNGHKWRAAHERDRLWLEETVQADDIVVTHHSPSWHGLRTSMQQSLRVGALSSGYYADMEPLIEKATPALWVHGHTHITREYSVGGCRIVTNALGRNRHNRDFQAGLVIELDEPAPRHGVW